MNARFYVPGSYATGDRIALPDDEARHVSRVLRLGPGAEVRVFNGTGHQFAARIESVSKGDVAVTVGEPCPAAKEPATAVTLAQAVLKADGMDDVVRDAVMLGVAAIVPIVTARTEVSLAALARGHRRERWERIAVSSAKQSGRAVVPPVLEPIAFDALIAGISRLAHPGPGVMLVEPAAATGALSLRDLASTPLRETTLLVGPEGGWTPQELDGAAGAVRPVTLGGRTLRANAMATVAVSALFAVWGEF